MARNTRTETVILPSVVAFVNVNYRESPRNIFRLNLRELLVGEGHWGVMVEVKS